MLSICFTKCRGVTLLCDLEGVLCVGGDDVVLVEVLVELCLQILESLLHSHEFGELLLPVLPREEVNALEGVLQIDGGEADTG